MELMSESKVKNAKKLIITLSFVIPMVVVVLFGIKIEGVDFSFLPPIYASINAFTAVTLILSLVAIKQGKKDIHKSLMNLSLLLSLAFLACYVAYHMTSDSTPYGGEYGMIYYPLLIMHISLSIVVVPLVLFTYLFAWQGDFVKHKKWTRFAFPIWLFVAVSGVIVYKMIAPYY